MAKDKSSSSKMVSPLYESGTMNGPAAGPKGGESVPDPMSYLSKSGMKAPGGSPSDRQASSEGERSTAH